MRSYLEEDVESRLGDNLKAWLGIGNFLYFKFKPVGIIGVPDRILLLRGGRIIFIELKKPSGSVKPWQSRMHASLRGLGFEVVVVWTLEDADAFRAWLI